MNSVETPITHKTDRVLSNNFDEIFLFFSRRYIPEAIAVRINGNNRMIAERDKIEI